jgi:hypothetical protein
MVKGANPPKILTVWANLANKLRTETVFKFYVESQACSMDNDKHARSLCYIYIV